MGKYIALKDAYLSVTEALRHAGVHNGVQVEIRWIDAEQIENVSGQDRDMLHNFFENIHGMVVPGVWRAGIEGKIEGSAMRENRVPFLGLCLGMHCP